jgi:CheY-like chemotaxis protein
MDGARGAESLVPAQILHVDDDDVSLGQAREFLQEEDVGGWGHSQVHSLQSFTDALGYLETHRVDLVILDVRLGGYEPVDTAPEDEQGVRTLDEIRTRRFVPIVFWTGLPGQVRHLQGPLVRILDKTDGLPALLDEVRRLFDTHLPAVNRALIHLLEEEQRRYMWKFVAENWDQLSEDGDHRALAYLLARRLGRSLSGQGIEQMAEELGTGLGRPTPGKIHATEIYIVPPLDGTNPAVGDLFCETVAPDTQLWWLAVTPSCDLEWNKAEWVVLAACQRDESDQRIRAWLDADTADTRRKVQDLMANKLGGQNDRLLFLPAAPTIPGLIADFQRLSSVTREQLDAMRRVASLASPFAEAMVSRFTRYFGRVGTDDLDIQEVMARLREASQV